MTSNSRPKRRPVAQGTVTDIPTRQKAGEWTDEHSKWKAAPNEKFHYAFASPSQAPYLKNRYGVETATRNSRFVNQDNEFVSNDDAYEKNDDGTFKTVERNGKQHRVTRSDVDLVCDLYVTYDPATVQANLDAAKAQREKAKAKAAKPAARK